MIFSMIFGWFLLGRIRENETNPDPQHWLEVSAAAVESSFTFLLIALRLNAFIMLSYIKVFLLVR